MTDMELVIAINKADKWAARESFDWFRAFAVAVSDVSGVHDEALEKAARHFDAMPKFSIYSYQDAAKAARSLKSAKGQK